MNMYLKFRILLQKFNLSIYINGGLKMLLLLAVLMNSGCKKFVEIESPKTSINGENVFMTDETSIAVLSGLYTWISGPAKLENGQFSSIGYITGLSSDELALNDGNQDDRVNFYQNNLVATLNFANFWNLIYPKIYITNSALEGLTKSNSLKSGVKKQLLGEAKFMRAFFYFYLVNLYGDVPLAISSDYTANAGIARTPKNQVWEQIIADLKDAKVLLSEKYLDGTLSGFSSERVRPTKWAASALLARVYLYTKDWKNADLESSSIIENSSLFHLEEIKNVFLKNNSEAIWQLQPVNAGFNTADAITYVITEFGPNGVGGVYLSDVFMKTFEAGDKRKTNWTSSTLFSDKNYPYAYKYKINTRDDQIVSPAQISEYNTVFRLAEQFLIRAEARAELTDIAGGAEDVDIIRNRAGLDPIKSLFPEIDQQQLLASILKERQLELFTEWGHRWFDLKRTGKVDQVMNVITPLKSNGGIWKSYQQYYAIPPYDIQKNNKLIQNPEY